MPRAVMIVSRKEQKDKSVVRASPSVEEVKVQEPGSDSHTATRKPKFTDILVQQGIH